MFNFKQKDDEFFDLFLESAKFFHTGALVLDDVMKDYTTTGTKVEEINRIEHEADAINDRIIDKLNLTFITPIDREDIYALANDLDDGVDLLQGILQRYEMYRMGKPMAGAINLTNLLISATEEVVRAVSYLENIRKNQVQILDASHKIERYESEGDLIYRSEVAYLFDNEKDPIELIRWKDVLEQLEDTLDHCELIADMLRGVVMKYA
ncbi:phosphate transport regulator [Selenomonas sp. oral taxon 920]|uniref:DUF47 domain-containing protein n=1 Tax=Selenomonas sp. oral taxon 920 TaxID=1884263 RepID=UPI000840B43C|nr:DUF47 family protein [Selenomonas sp. oral taxon 920]AOH47911.1 phosphate transport regulator [Selenomonas sp. oral taxon 920]